MTVRAMPYRHCRRLTLLCTPSTPVSCTYTRTRAQDELTASTKSLADVNTKLQQASDASAAAAQLATQRQGKIIELTRSVEQLKVTFLGFVHCTTKFRTLVCDCLFDHLAHCRASDARLPLLPLARHLHVDACANHTATLTTSTQLHAHTHTPLSGLPHPQERRGARPARAAARGQLRSRQDHRGRRRRQERADSAAGEGGPAGQGRRRPGVHAQGMCA
jgi:hypothetical protein